MPVHELVTSRPGQKHPPYLAKLETLTVAPPRKQHPLVSWACGAEWEEMFYQGGLEFGGLRNVGLRRWKEGDEGKLVEWEPKSWC